MTFKVIAYTILTAFLLISQGCSNKKDWRIMTLESKKQIEDVKSILDGVWIIKLRNGDGFLYTCYAKKDSDALMLNSGKDYHVKFQGNKCLIRLRQWKSSTPH